jgi:hypothetical protein
MSDFSGVGLGDYVDSFELPSEVRKAPIWPVALGLVFLVVSIILAILGLSLEGTPLLVDGLLGYLLTPLGTAFVLIMAMRAHRQLSTVDGYVADSGTRIIRFTAIIAGAGFLVAIPHIWQVADYFALLLAPGA